MFECIWVEMEKEMNVIGCVIGMWTEMWLNA